MVVGVVCWYVSVNANGCPFSCGSYRGLGGGVNGGYQMCREKTPSTISCAAISFLLRRGGIHTAACAPPAAMDMSDIPQLLVGK